MAAFADFMQFYNALNGPSVQQAEPSASVGGGPPIPSPQLHQMQFQGALRQLMNQYQPGGANSNSGGILSQLSNMSNPMTIGQPTAQPGMAPQSKPILPTLLGLFGGL